MPRRRPPGPRDPLFGLNEVREVRRDMLAYYAGLHRLYGDAARVRFGPFVQHVFFHPDQIKEVLLTKADRFEKIARARAVLSQWDGNGLVLSEGEFWRRQRRLMQPAFHHDRVARMAGDMVSITAELREEWAARCARGGGHCDVEVNDAMTALALNIASKTLFGADVSDQTARLGAAVAFLSDEAVRELQEPLTLPRWVPLARVRRKWEAIELIDRTTRDIIAERRASGEDRGDLLSMLLAAVDEEGDGAGMTDEQARDEAVTLFLAGHDTSAAALTWVFYQLARHADARGRVERELDDALGGAPPTMADLRRLPYLEMVVRETLRLNPPAVGLFPRQATEDVEIGGYRVRRGEQVQLMTYVTQRDPRWFPDPERFDPERFAPGRAEEIPQHAYFPFGAGPRVCIGRQFALVELQIVAATLLQHLSVRTLPGAADAGLHARLSLRPEGGLRLRWTMRRGSEQ
ncbi:MAG: cytochrome P450 [Acidobacteria bacterium]|nr:cytochrome P450 [Acidobacteriota bacterium]